MPNTFVKSAGVFSADFITFRRRDKVPYLGRQLAHVRAMDFGKTLISVIPKAIKPVGHVKQVT